MATAVLRLVTAAALALAAFTADEAAAADSPSPTITLPNGATITGTSQVNVAGNQVNVYRGIPYAEPPVGERRWKQTTLKPISEDVDATAQPYTCWGVAGFDVDKTRYPMSEDCLFINVYTPATATRDAKLPVMVWIHGGAFVAGSGNVYNGSNIVAAADEKAVVVTFNYRLGIFGFLSNNDILAEGDGANFALRDQETAFHWVKQYIEFFGGDPNDIAAFGESAGSISIAMHMISREGDQALFSKAIMQSGVHLTAHDTTSVSLQANYSAITAAGVGCAGAANVLACLRRTDASAIFAAGRELPFRPIVDNVFMLDVPIRRVLAGKISRVPSIVGVTTDEGWIFTFGIDKASQFDSWIHSRFPLLTEAEHARVAALYPTSSFQTPHHRVSEIFGDIIFVCPSDLFTQTLAKTDATPTFYYRFNQTATTFGHPLAIHTADIDYVFNNVAKLPVDADARSTVVSMQKYWVNFVNTASPNDASAWMQPRDVVCAATSRYGSLPAGQDPAQLVWPRLEDENRQHIILQATPVLETPGAYMPDRAERCAFWTTVDLRIATHVFE